MARKSNTRAAQGSGTIRQRKDGRWEARYVVGHDPGTGKLIRRSVYGATQKEVRQKLTSIVAALDDGTYQAPNKITVGEWLDIWIKEYVGDVKPLTLVSYQGIIDHKLKPNLGAIKLNALTAPIIQQLYNKLLEGSAKASPLSAKTVKNVHGVLHSALKQAVLVDYIRSNPADAVKVPRAPKAELSIMEGEDIARFLKVIQGTRFETLFLIDLFTGLRRGELLGLTWDCIDFKRRRITVKRQLQFERGKNARFYLNSPKNGKGRVLAIPPTVLQLFTTQRRWQAEWRLRNGPIWLEDGDVYTDASCQKREPVQLVFTDEQGKHIMPDVVYHAFKKAAAQIGKPELRFHDLRHAYAVASIQAGDDVKIVQHNLGHATAAFTLDVYAAAWDSMKDASADRMEGFIQSIGVNSGVK